MTTRQVQAAVARATGEDEAFIAQRGFSLVEENAPLEDDDWEAFALDWDELDTQRRGTRPVSA